MKIPAVSLQMDDSPRLQEVPVSVHEKRRRQPLLLSANLRVGECDPYLRNLSGSKEGLDELDTGPQKSHIRKPVLRSILRPLPETRPLDIDTYIIAGGIPLRQIYGIVSLTAAQFQDYRLVIPEEISSPASFQGMVSIQNLRSLRLNETPERLILPEFPQLIFSHDYSCGFSCGLS